MFSEKYPILVYSILECRIASFCSSPFIQEKRRFFVKIWSPPEKPATSPNVRSRFVWVILNPIFLKSNPEKGVLTSSNFGESIKSSANPSSFTFNSTKSRKVPRKDPKLSRRPAVNAKKSNSSPNPVQVRHKNLWTRLKTWIEISFYHSITFEIVGVPAFQVVSWLGVSF